MLIVAAFLAVSLVAVVIVMTAHMRASELMWAKERGVLLERIQRPEQRPTVAPALYAVPDPIDDEWDLVGAIRDPSDNPEVPSGPGVPA